MAGLSDEHLEFVVDGNPNLRGCFTPVTGFCIEEPDSVSRDTVDEVIVFNYGYIERSGTPFPGSSRTAAGSSRWSTFSRQATVSN